MSLNNTSIKSLEIDTAIDIWISDKAYSTTTYKYINNFDMSAISDFSNLLSTTKKAKPFTFKTDISNWFVSTGSNFNSIFSRVSALNQNIGKWDVTKITNYSCVFGKRHFWTHEIYFNSDIRYWNINQAYNFLNNNNLIKLCQTLIFKKYRKR